MGELEALAPETRNLIDGERVEASRGGTFDNLNPATEEVLGTCSDGTQEDMEAAIAAARRAFDETDWARECTRLRARCLRAIPRGAWSRTRSSCARSSCAKRARLGFVDRDSCTSTIQSR